MKALSKVASCAVLAWGLAAQAAPLAPRLLPGEGPLRSTAPTTSTSSTPSTSTTQTQTDIRTTEPERRDWGDRGDDIDSTTYRRESDSGAYVLLGGGLDGYTGGLAEQVTVGPQAGALVGVKGRILGVELGYSAGGAELQGGGGDGNAGSGIDLLRNSGQAAVTVGLTNTPFQPFVMAGGGVDRYTVNNGESLGAQDATGFYAPVGAGIRWNLNRLLTLDARGNYDFLFGDEFLPGEGGNRFRAQASLGGTF
jgi:hypothetical protein